MPQRNVTRTATRSGPRHKAPSRSASAARAHAAGDVRWTIDLGQPAVVGVQRSVDASRTYALAGLSLVTSALWLYDIATLVTHAH